MGKSPSSRSSLQLDTGNYRVHRYKQFEFSASTAVMTNKHNLHRIPAHHDHDNISTLLKPNTTGLRYLLSAQKYVHVVSGYHLITSSWHLKLMLMLHSSELIAVDTF